VYKVKCKADGTLDKHKARLVAKGFTQKKELIMKRPLLPQQRYERDLFSSSHGSTIWLETIPDGCEECLPQWRFGGRSIHVPTTRFSSSGERAYGLLIEESSLWPEACT
jgi:hypothetical protein